MNAKMSGGSYYLGLCESIDSETKKWTCWQSLSRMFQPKTDELKIFLKLVLHPHDCSELLMVESEDEVHEILLLMRKAMDRVLTPLTRQLFDYLSICLSSEVDIYERYNVYSVMYSVVRRALEYHEEEILDLDKYKLVVEGKESQASMRAETNTISNELSLGSDCVHQHTEMEEKKIVAETVVAETEHQCIEVEGRGQ